MKKIKLELHKKKATRVVFFRTDEDIYHQIEKVAKRKKVSISTLMRAFVELAIKNIN